MGHSFKFYNVFIVLSVAFLTNGCGPDDEKASDNEVVPSVEPLYLDAFTDFSCSGNWTNRDGGLGLRAGTGSGNCHAVFPGPDGDYSITLLAQTEFDGAPRFSIRIDGSTIKSGEYPMSRGELVCDCPNWRVNCPDIVVPIEAGTHSLRKGQRIDFFGEEVYPCGPGHGAYAKWRKMRFTPQ